MKFYIDSIDLTEIKAITDVYPIGGVTCNPSIVAKNNPENFFLRLQHIRSMVDFPLEMHVQVFHDEANLMIEDAKLIIEKLGKEVFIKIPANPEGYIAMQACKQLGFHVTATAIYTYIQAVCSLESGADALAPYVNRIENNKEDPYVLIDQLVKLINKDYPQARIIGASFKKVYQVEQALIASAHHVTLSKEVFDIIGANEHVEQAVAKFLSDWKDYTLKHPL